ncbi:hypothetical protein KM043_015551 [Ampulex compressa]|nr:hypothetical protein KM043_015551 [Ampulex compressa]
MVEEQNGESSLFLRGPFQAGKGWRNGMRIRVAHVCPVSKEIARAGGGCVMRSRAGWRSGGAVTHPCNHRESLFSLVFTHAPDRAHTFEGAHTVPLAGNTDTRSHEHHDRDLTGWMRVEKAQDVSEMWKVMKSCTIQRGVKECRFESL